MTEVSIFRKQNEIAARSSDKVLTFVIILDTSTTGMKLGAQDMIILNDPIAVRDLIAQRQVGYSCRTDLFMRSFGDNLNIAWRELVLHVFSFFFSSAAIELLKS
jgi:hypothetical protein